MLQGGHGRLAGSEEEGGTGAGREGQEPGPGAARRWQTAGVPVSLGRGLSVRRAPRVAPVGKERGRADLLRRDTAFAVQDAED
jgi:phage terminase Nu1 subunit (DNA packaging protein)